MYNAIQQVLQRIEADIEAAELQGIISGFIAVAPDANDQAWVTHVVNVIDAEDAQSQKSVQVLRQLRKVIQEQLADENLTFSPLLPKDEEPIKQRMQAIVDWSQGFMLGISLGGLKETRHLSKPSAEFIADLPKFSRLEIDIAENNESETAYTEVVEYLKVGAITVFLEHAEKSLDKIAKKMKKN
jgi:yecA family protein